MVLVGFSGLIEFYRPGRKTDNNLAETTAMKLITMQPIIAIAYKQ